MDSFEFTKIAGAVLTALLLIFGTKVLIEERMPGPPAKPGYTLPVAEAGATADAGKADEGAAPADAASGPAAVMAALPKASADAGKTLFAKCKTCHTIEKGKPKGVGPNLWGVVGRTKGAAENFRYSKTLKMFGGVWTEAEISSFIAGPRSFVPDTKMTFSGLKKAEERAHVIAFLKTLAD